jgi:hypothetical protein
MKFITILVVFLTLSQLSLNICGTISRTHVRTRRTRTRTRRTGQATNKWYQLFMGILFGMTSKNDTEIAKINSCLPTPWKLADTTKAKEDGAKAEPKSTFTQILDGVEKVIKFVCQFKSNIKALFARRVRRQMRRNKYRMLVETRVARYKKALWWWNDVADTVKSAFGAVVDWTKKAWNDVKNFASDFVKNIGMFWDNLKAKVSAFLNSDFVAQVKAIVACAIQLKDVAKAFIDVVKGTVSKITSLASIAAGNIPELAKVLIDLVCNFADFRAAFSLLGDAVNENDMIKRYNLLGQFLGKFAKAMTTRKR